MPNPTRHSSVAELKFRSNWKKPLKFRSNWTPAVAGAVLAFTIGGIPATAAGQAAPADAAGPGVASRAIEVATRLLAESGANEVKNGIYPELSNMIAGSGWISGGPGFRQWLWEDRALVDASAAVSWRGFKMAQARFELRRLARSRIVAGTQLRWQDATQLTYYGTGPESREEDRSEYRLRSANLVGYMALRPARWLSLNGEFGWLAQPSLDGPAGAFRRDVPDAREIFADDAVYRRNEQPSYFHGGVSLVADTRDHAGYPSAGSLMRAGWTHYADRDTDAFTFDRYEAEAAHFVPLADSRVVLALHGWIAASDTAMGRVVPFYLQPSLGGSNSLRGYDSYRFHDRNLLLVQAEARVPIASRLDGALFVDAGSVAARVGDLNLDHRSYGAGLRLHSRRSTFARLDVARGQEGWRFLLRLNDPFRFGRVSRRTAAIPFVP